MIGKNRNIEVIMEVCLLAGAFFLFACGTKKQGSHSELNMEQTRDETIKETEQSSEQLVDERLVGLRVCLDVYEIIGL